MARRASNRAILMGVLSTLILPGCNSKPAAKPQAVGAAQPNTVQAPAQPSPAQQPKLEGVGFHGGESRETVASRMSELGFQADGDCATPKGDSGRTVDCNFVRNEDEKVQVFLDNGAVSGMTYEFSPKRDSDVLEQLTKTLGSPNAPRIDDGPSDRYWCKDSEPSATCHATVMLIRSVGERSRVVLILQPRTDSESKLAEPFPVPRIQTASEIRQEKIDAAGCNSNWVFDNGYKQSAQHRRDFASTTGEAFEQAFPGVATLAAGRENEYLLFVADPANEDSVRGALELYRQQKPLRVRACLEGFNEIQFITRDDTYQQKLIGNIKPTWKEYFEFYMKANAQPMR